MSTEFVADLSNEEYHAHDSASHSTLEVLRQSRQLFHARFVARTLVEKVPPKKQENYDFGNAFHALAVEPHAFAERFAFCEAEHKSTKPEKEKWAKAAEENPGCKILRPSIRGHVEGMVASLRAHPLMGPVIDDEHSVAESSMFWTDEETGEHLRCRPDLMRKPGKSPGIMLDLKSTEDVNPTKVAKTFVNLGYHRQQAHYSMGYRAAFDMDVELFVFAFVSKKPPYEVAAFTLDDGSAELGWEQRRRDIQNLARCRTEGFTSPWNKNIATLVLPAFAHFED